MRSVIQRYHAGDRNMRGKTGPSMKILPKKLPKNRVTTKYRPRADTAICGEGDTQKHHYKSESTKLWLLTFVNQRRKKKNICLIKIRGCTFVPLVIFPQTVENPGQTFLLWNVNKGIFLQLTNSGYTAWWLNTAAVMKWKAVRTN